MPAPQFHPLRFGSLDLQSNLFLSPLAGYTTLPFRLTVRELGGLDLCTTDLVNVRSLLRRNPLALKLVATCPEDAPLSVQLFGADPVEMRDAAQMLEGMGIASVDINMGCPVDKVVRTGSGSLLMTSRALAEKIVATMVGAVRIPVTAKMRLGWDEHDLSAPGLARALEGAGAAAVFVHGRTRAQGFSGKVSLRGIRAVVEAVDRIPVIANGDVTSPLAVRRMLEETGAAGVSIGRGAFYDPWIFSRTMRFLQSGLEPPPARFEERIALMRTHLRHMARFHGEEKGCVLFRKTAAAYTRRIGPSAYFRRRITSIESQDAFEALLEGFCQWRRAFLDDSGELLPRYRPSSIAVAFADDENPTSDPDGIPVPKGPIAAW